MNLVEFLKEKTLDCGDSTAFKDSRYSITYREFWAKVDNLAENLIRLGVEKDSRVVICLPTSIGYAIAFLAALRASAVAVPVKQAMTSTELKKIVRDVKPVCFISNKSFLNRIFTFEYKFPDDDVVFISRNAMKVRGQQRSFSLKKMIFNETDPSDGGEERMASINFTYRGFGVPLGALLTHENYCYGIELYVAFSRMKSARRVLLAFPLSYIFSLISSFLAPLSVGATIVVADKADPKESLDIIAREQIDMLGAAPSFYKMLLDNFDPEIHSLASLRQCIVGGSPLSAQLYDQVKQKLGIELFQGYGLTETMPVVCNMAGEYRPLSLGRPLDKFDLEIKVLKKDGTVCAPDEEGEIFIKGKTVCRGYFKRQDITEEVFVDGWCRTGDIGSYDKDGFLYWKGLCKRIVKVAGNIVDISEVENRLCAYPGVTSVDVYIEEHALWGNILCADITVNDPENFDPRKLRQYLRKNLISYKVPRINIQVRE